MTGKTHAAAGAFLGALAGKLAGEPYLGLALGALGGLLPDIDHPGSWAGRRLRPLAVVLETLFGHRTVTHTLWFALALGAAGLFLGAALGAVLSTPAWLWALALFLGALSHLVLDACTRSGVEPLAPFLPWHPRGPVATGGLLDYFLAAAFVLVAAGMTLKF